MRQSITLLVLSVAVFSSCTTAYKSGQTPDDVYYSPVRQQAAYVQTEQKEERPVQTTEESYEDRFLRMRVEDRYRWSALDDYYLHNTYAYNSYGNYYSLNSPWNSYWAWNCHYNPYYGGMPYYPGGVIKTQRNYIRPSRALVFNPSSYNIGSTGATSTGTKGLNNSYYNRYNNNNRTSNSLGESIRKVFSNGSNSGSYNSGSNSSTPSRSYSPSSSSSSSSGGGGGSRSSGGGGGVSRPSR